MASLEERLDSRELKTAKKNTVATWDVSPLLRSQGTKTHRTRTRSRGSKKKKKLSTHDARHNLPPLQQEHHHHHLHLNKERQIINISYNSLSSFSLLLLLPHTYLTYSLTYLHLQHITLPFLCFALHSFAASCDHIKSYHIILFFTLR